MRTAFHEQLGALQATLGDMCGIAGVSMERATQALLQADLLMAEKVITDHDWLLAMATKAEESAASAASRGARRRNRGFR